MKRNQTNQRPDSSRQRDPQPFTCEWAIGTLAPASIKCAAFGAMFFGITAAAAVEPLLELERAGEPVGFSADGSLLFTADRTNLFTWERTTGSLLDTKQLPEGIRQISYDGTVVAVNEGSVGSQRISLRNINTGEIICVLLHDDWPSSYLMRFSPDGSKLLWAGGDENTNSAWVWDTTSCAVAATWSRSRQTHAFGTGAFSPRGDQMLIGGASVLGPDERGGWLQLWTFGEDSPTVVELLVTNEVEISAVAFSADGSIRVTNAV